MATSVRDRCQAHPISKIYAAEAAGIGQTPGRPWTKSVKEQSRLYELLAHFCETRTTYQLPACCQVTVDNLFHLSRALDLYS